MKNILSLLLLIPVLAGAQNVVLGYTVNSYVAPPTTIYPVSYVAVGDRSATTQIATPNIPSGVLAGDLILVHVSSKTVALEPSVPTDFSLMATYTGGLGTDGQDRGAVRNTVFYKVAVGGESGTTITTQLSALATIQARVFVYRKTGGTWAFENTSGVDNVNDLTWLTTESGPINVREGDAVVTFTTVNSDAFTFTTHSITGVNVGASILRGIFATSQGNDLHSIVIAAPATATPNASGSPVLNIATDGLVAAGLNSPTGVTHFLRLRAQ